MIPAMALPDYEAELTAVNEAIAAVLARKGVKSLSVRGRQLSNMSLTELKSFRDDILRDLEQTSNANPFGIVHGVAQRQGGP